MKKILLAGMLSSGAFICAYAQPDVVYYYYEGNKIHIQQTYERLALGLKDEKLLAKTKPVITGLLNINSDSIKQATGLNQLVLHLNIEQQLTAKAAITTLLKNNGISYVHPFLKGSRGTLGSYGDNFLVKLKKGTTENQFQNLLKKYRCSIIKKPVADENTYLLSAGKVNGYDALKLANIFFETQFFEFSQPDFTTYGGFSTPPNDPLYNLLWAHKNTGFPEQYNGTPGADMRVDSAWLITMGNPNIKIAVIDMGVDTGHADLKPNLLQGYDCLSNTSNVGDGRPRNLSNAHGTACAGIVAAVANNSIGIAGIAPNCKIIPVNMVDEGGGFAPESGIAAGFDYAWQHGADVLTNSWYLAFPSGIMDDAIHRAVTQGRGGKGSVVFFATGNENSGISYPAYNPEVIAVGGVSMCGERKSSKSCDGEYWWGANYGTGLDVVAPCIKIATCDNMGENGYNKLPGTHGDYNTLFNGTSAAAPHAAAVAALVLSVDASFTAKEVRTIIESSCDKTGEYLYGLTEENINGTWNDEMGYGRINAYKSVLAAKNRFFCNVGIKPLASYTLCKNASATLQVVDETAEATYTWRQNEIDFQTGSSIKVVSGGVYNVVARFSNGCTAISAGVTINNASNDALIANAGSEVLLCTASNGVRIGGVPSAKGGNSFIATKRAFGYDKLFGRLIKFNPQNPREHQFLDITISSIVVDKDFAAGDFTPYGYYAVTRTGNLYRIDTSSGAAAYIGKLNPESGQYIGREWSGLAWDPSRSKLYALTFKGLINKLYEVDPFSGNTIPNIQLPGNSVTWIAFNSTGSLYGFSYNSNRIVGINKITGGIRANVSEDIGINNLSFLDGSFDPLDNKIYFNTFTLANQKLTEDLRVVDTLTGKVTVKGVIGTLNHVAGLAIAGGTYQYTWSPSAGLSNIHDANPLANPSQTTTYTLTITDACGQKASNQVTVKVNAAKPPIKITAFKDSICVGDTVRLIATKNNNYKYQWWLNGKIIPGANDTFYVARRSGKFRVSVTNGPGGCANTSPVFTVKDCSIWLNNNQADTTCSSYFYASHGNIDSSFRPNESFTKTIYPPRQGDLLKIKFSSFTMYNVNDKLTIFDGPDQNSPVLRVFSLSNQSLGVDIFSSTGPLTFSITSGSGSNNYGWWDAFIECYTPKVYRTAGSGDIEDISTWEVKTGPNNFTYATQLPRYLDDSIIIRSGHTVTKSKLFYNALDQVWLQKGAKLVAKQQFSLFNGKGYDLIADGDIEIDRFGSIGGGDSLLIRGNITGQDAAIFAPCYIAGESPQTLYFTSCYFNSLHILNKTNVVIKGLIRTESLNISTTGRLTIDSAEITNLLALKNGIIDIADMGQIKASASYRLQVEGGSKTSFVNGPLSLPINSRGTFKLNYPIGRNNIYKPVTLTINKQSFPYEDQYKVQVINQNPGFRPFEDSSIFKVSSFWHFNIKSQKRNPVTSLIISLPYEDENEFTNPARLRIARDSAYKWVNIGGDTSYLPGSIKSTLPVSIINNNTNVFGDFVIAESRDTGTVLPVTFLNFTAEHQRNSTLLKWTVTNEVNCDSYAVEHSEDGYHFSQLSAVLCRNTRATQTYHWLHPYPISGTNFYRIKETDKNGSISYSGIKTVDFENEEGVTVTPNPAKEAVNVAAKEIIKEIRCYSITGQLIKKVLISNRQYRLQIQELNAGVYTLRIITTSGVFNKRIIKQ